jgi:L-amino acid N-acyltransferase
MMVHTLEIRDATTADLPAMLEIYNDAVLTTTAVWDDNPRTLHAQEQWFDAKRAQGHPVLVALRGSDLAGFCSYGPFRPWPGYRFTVENSIYTHPSHRRRGVAPRLLTSLVERATAQGMHCIIGGIEAQNLASIQLHASVGYAQGAHLHQVGWKFGRWLDLVLMERRLSAGN